jgi:hypothetical protein
LSGTPTVGSLGNYSNIIISAINSAGSVSLPAFSISVIAAPSQPTNVTATAGNGQSVVTFNPPASNGNSTITSYSVTANPGNITASGSSSPITITGLDNNTNYIFTVTASNSAGQGPAATASNLYGLNLTINGTGSGFVNSNPSGISGTSGTGIFHFAYGSSLTLNTTILGGYQFSGWGLACSGTGSCKVNFNSLFQFITATFDILPYAQIVGNSKLYGLLQSAYDSASDGSVIDAQMVTFTEDLVLKSSKSVTLKGGFFDSSFTSQMDNTTLQGSLTIELGSLIVDRLNIE